MKKVNRSNEFHVISLGAGKQSTYMLIEALRGRFGIIPDAAVFCDLGAEPSYVYENLQRLSDFCLSQHNFKIDVISKGAIDAHIVDFVNGTIKNDSAPPFYLSAGGMMKRHCTEHFKIRPIRQYLTKNRGGRKVFLWIGISLDEIERMKHSPVKYISHKFPLIEHRISLSQIISFFENSTFQMPGKSACFFCPFRSDKQWRIIKKNFPADFQKACQFDEQIRNYPGLTSKAFLHRTLQPLSKVDFSFPVSLFPDLIEECEGLCGL